VKPLLPKGIKPYTPLSFDDTKNFSAKELEDEKYKKYLKKGYDEGFNSGYEDGLKKGYDEGIKKAQNEIKKKAEKINNIAGIFKKAIDELSHLKTEQIKAFLPEILKLSIKIAEKIVATKISLEKSLIIAIVKEALKSVPLNEEKVIIRLNPEDYNFLKENFKELELDEKMVDIEPSPDIRSGGCYIETISKEIDSTIEQKLKEIEDALSSVFSEEG
jgi:flagellar assembly protein FliH